MTISAEIAYRTGDATRPVAEGPKIICHVCNDSGGWGAGFVLALSRRWPEPEAAYLDWCEGRTPDAFELGAIQLVDVEPGLQVANMIAQENERIFSGEPPIRYDAVRTCLTKLAAVAAKAGSSVHMPRIGCGIAGGSWDEIEPIIEQALLARGVPVTVYDFG